MSIELSAEEELIVSELTAKMWPFTGWARDNMREMVAREMAISCLPVVLRWMNNTTEDLIERLS